MKGRLALLLVALLALGGSVAAQAAEPVVTITKPQLNPPIYNAIATWDPLTATACLYSASSLVEQPTPDLPWAKPGECSVWTPPSMTLQGIYDLTWDNGQSHAPLVISANPSVDTHARTLVLVPDYTWQAYNLQSGGNFYFNGSTKKTEEEFVKGALNLMRPNNFVRVGDPEHWPTVTQNFPAVNPIELLRNNIGRVDVIQQSLLDTYNYNLNKYNTIVIYGHDEYWTTNVRSSIEGAVRNGTSLLNLSGNTGFRKILREGDVIHFAAPNDKTPKTSVWGDLPGDTSPERLLGVRYVGQPYNMNLKRPIKLDQTSYLWLQFLGMPKNVPIKSATELLNGMRVMNAKNPLYNGTGLKTGQWFGVKSKAVSYEVDGIPLTPAGKPNAAFFNLFAGDEPSYAAETWLKPYGPLTTESRTGMLVLNSLGKGLVFSTGSVGWMAATLKDKVLQRITLNAYALLQR